TMRPTGPRRPALPRRRSIFRTRSAALPSAKGTGNIDRPGVRRREVRRLRAILHQAPTAGLEAQNRLGRPNFRAWLQGKIAYVKMARPEVGARLVAALQALPANDIV